MVSIHVTQADGNAHRRQAAGGSLRPFDEDDRLLEVRLECRPVRLGEALEAVEVEMADAVVAVADRVGRARHRPCDPERTSRSADEGRLPGPEFTGDGDHVARPEQSREPCRDLLRFLRRRGDELYLTHSWSSSVKP